MKFYHTPLAIRRSFTPQSLLTSAFLCFVSVVAIGLLGCTDLFRSLNMMFSNETPEVVQAMPPGKLYFVHNYDLCAAYHGSTTPAIKTELERRGLIDSTDWPRINAHDTWKGMTYCDLFASLGRPYRFGNSEDGGQSGPDLVLNPGESPLILSALYPHAIYFFKDGELTRWEKT